MPTPIHPLARTGLGLAGLLVATGGTNSLCSADADTIVQAITEGAPSLALRYRLEYVDQDRLPKEAVAHTVRAALGYRTGTWKGISGFLEFETTQAVGDELYSSPADPLPGRPVVADPEHTEVNQAYLQYTGIEGLTGTFGRQKIIHDGARFVGDVGWRQNQQTFDALRTSYTTAELPLTVEYSFVWNVNRIFSDRSQAPVTAGTTGDDYMASHLLHGSYRLEDIGTASAFVYLLDYEYRNALDSTTFGARFAGSRPLSEDLKALYEVSLASQSDSGDNTADLSEIYLFAEAGVSWRWLTAKLGYESLGGDGSVAFQTPLATLHKFNGWSDQFLVTPAGGLVDLYLTVAGTVPTAPGLKWSATYHSFETEEDGADLGEEIDLLATYPLKNLADKLVIGAKAALYDGPADDDDTTKLWLWTQWSF